MSLYDLTNRISEVTRTRYITKYSSDYDVAIIHNHNRKTSLKYKDYTKFKLKELVDNSKDKLEIDMKFWDPDFCSHEHLMRKDIDIVSQRLDIKANINLSKIVVGYIVSLITLYKVIYRSFSDNKYNINTIKLDFDKNIMMRLFCDFDMVIEFNENLIQFITSIFNQESMVNLCLTPSGKFRFVEKDIKYFLNGTKYPHDISCIIVNSTSNVEKILNYHLELVKICDEIYSPEFITSYRAENFLLNLLKLNIDMDIHENILFNIINHYVDKNGSLDIVFDIDTDKYENIQPMLDAIKEYRLSSNSSNF